MTLSRIQVPPTQALIVDQQPECNVSSFGRVRTENAVRRGERLMLGPISLEGKKRICAEGHRASQSGCAALAYEHQIGTEDHDSSVRIGAAKKICQE